MLDSKQFENIEFGQRIYVYCCNMPAYTFFFAKLNEKFMLVMSCKVDSSRSREAVHITCGVLSFVHKIEKDNQYKVNPGCISCSLNYHFYLPCCLSNIRNRNPAAAKATATPFPSIHRR